MADDNTTIKTDIVVNADVKKSIQEVDKLTKSFDALNKKMQKTLDTAKKVKNSMPSASPASISMRNSEGEVLYSGGTKNRAEVARLNKIINSISNRGTAMKKIADTQYFLKETTKRKGEAWAEGQEFRNLHKELLLLMKQEKAARHERMLVLQEANRTEKDRLSDLTTRRLAADVEMKEYRNAHKDLFTPQGRQPRYIIGRGISNFGQSLKGGGIVGRMVGDVAEVVGKFIINPLTGVTAAFVNFGKAVTDVGKEALEAAQQIESLKTNLSVVFGSQTQANKAFGDIAKYAVKSPFGIEQTTEMAILLKQSGVHASDLMDTLKMIGDTAGGNAEKMQRIANNYAQIVSIGKASMLDMRQFAYAGIPIFEAVSKELGVSNARLREMISNGEVTADIIKGVFQDLTGIGGLFENATAKGAKTMKARLQNLKDARQLAMSQIGDRILSTGKGIGRDSYAMSAIGWFEEFFQKVESLFSSTNLEKRIEIISDSQKQLVTLQNRLIAAEKDGSTLVAGVIKEEIKGLKEEASPDAVRATFFESYQNKMNEFYSALDAVKDIEGVKYLADLEKEKDRRLNLRRKLDAKHMRNQGFFAPGSDERRIIDNEYNTAVNALVESMSVLDVAIKALSKGLRLTEDDIKAANEQFLLDTQQKALDAMSDLSTKKGSAFNTISSIKEIYEQSKRGQQERAAEEKISREKTLALLEELKKSGAVTNNKVDVSKLSVSDFMKFYEPAAIWGTGRLNIVDNQNASAEEKIAFKRMFDNVMDNILTEMRQSGMSDMAGNLATGYANSVGDARSANFSQEFISYFEAIHHIIEGFADKELKSKLLNYLDAATTEMQTDTSVTDLDLSSGDFVALWKRILSSATGINTDLIHSTKETLDFYHSDLSARKQIGNTFGALLRSGDIDVRELGEKTVFSGKFKKLPDEGIDIAQIDLQNTRDNVEKLAKSLLTSTEALDAWRNSLFEEKNTLINLISSGILTPETQATSLREVEDKLGISHEMAVNAFGENMYHKKTGAKLTQKDGKVLDEAGNEIETELVGISGDIYTIIMDFLKELGVDIAESEPFKALKDLRDNLADVGKDFLQSGYTAPFEAWGKSLVTGADAMKDLQGRMHQITAGMLQQVGPVMARAGFEMIASGANMMKTPETRGKGLAMIAGGLGLAAAGGFASGFGAGMFEADDGSERDNADKQTQKLQNLKDQLAELLKQARSDALYYENNLRHKTALGINREFSYKSVNDAIITPSGDVVSTHPDDYLIATKTPGALGGSPNINFTVINNAGPEVTVRQEKRTNRDGTTEVRAIIETVVGEYISSNRSDDAFAMRDARSHGNRSIM